MRNRADRRRHGRRWLSLAALLLAIALPPTTARAQEAGARVQQEPSSRDSTRTRRLDLLRASRAVQEVVGGARVRRLTGNVWLRQDSTLFWADRVTDSFGRAVLERNVRIVEHTDTLTADEVVYLKATKVGEARGRVRLSDGEAVLTAPSGFYDVEQRLATFLDSVRLQDSVSVLTSLGGTYHMEDKLAVFYDRVVLTQDRSRLASDSLRHDRNEDRSVARGRVLIEQIGEGSDEGPVDSTLQTYLFGEAAVHANRDGYSRIEGNPLLLRFRVDSAGVDTLAIRASVLESVRRDTLERLIGVDSVRIWQRDMAAVADSVVYEKLAEEPAPALHPADSLAPEDSIAPEDSLAPEEALPPMNEPRAPPGREELRLFGGPVIWFRQTQVTGDTVRVRLLDGRVDSIFVDGRAFVAQLDTVTARIQQIRGKALRGLVERDTLRALRVGPNAEAVYFRSNEQEGILEDAVQLSSDRITFLFEDGDIDRVKAYSGIEGKVYDRDAIPDDLRLDGFSWSPERKPQRDAFFTDEDRMARLRDRLAFLGRPLPSPAAELPDPQP